MSTKKLQTICSILISLLLLFVVSSCSKKIISEGTITKSSRKVSFIPVSDSLLKMKAVIFSPKMQISGIMVVKQRNDSLLGVFINEFGIKGFDFVVADNQCVVHTNISRINKWYIKKTIANDLLFIFTPVYMPEKQDTSSILSIVNRNKTYRYTLSNNKITSAERMLGNKKTGQIHKENDSVYVGNNLQHNLTYTMNIIQQ
jgi:hypothetical protein